MKKNHRKYVLSTPSRSDLQTTMRHGIERWGIERAREYAEQLDEALRMLAAHPDAGSKRPDLIPDIRCFPVASHVVYYRKQTDLIEIVRILHKRMDASILNR